ncbi:MAG: dTDP-4-dehydrorhamnose 3,5-epimerase [candidate division Zixibacteria bacterium]|nr:dTDP-4-dehydrorhamnose 3,5-epimerase [candidate division Zixibacteria bacterium]
MIQTKCNIKGVEIRKLEKFSDERGWLCEFFRQDEIKDGKYPVMSYISATKPGVSRGPHEHRFQTDYICFPGQSIFKVFLWDNRADSGTFGDSFIFEVKENSPTMIIIPPGVVHAYKNIGEIEGMILNAPDRLYAGVNHEEPVDEIRYEEQSDNKFKIDD